MPDPIILYGTPTCPMIPPVRGMLRRAGADFQYIDISRDDQARTRVRDINNGNESVPTLVFPNGTTLTEPSGAQLQARLEADGYTVQPPALWQRFAENPFFSLLGLAALIFGFIDGNWVFLVVGVALLAVTLWKSQ